MVSFLCSVNMIKGVVWLTCPACKLVDDESTDKAAEETNDGSDGDRSGGLAKGDSSNEDHCL